MMCIVILPYIEVCASYPMYGLWDGLDHRLTHLRAQGYIRMHVSMNECLYG